MAQYIIIGADEDGLLINPSISINNKFKTEGILEGFYTKNEIKSFIDENYSMFGIKPSEAYISIDKLNNPIKSNVNIVDFKIDENVIDLKCFIEHNDDVYEIEAAISSNKEILEWYSNICQSSSYCLKIENNLKDKLLCSSELNGCLSKVALLEAVPKSVRERIHRKFRKKKNKRKISPKGRIAPKKHGDNDPE